jgi:methylmalonyl-CoA/ethylmalonyl-CoA epimerase
MTDRSDPLPDPLAPEIDGTSACFGLAPDDILGVDHVGIAVADLAAAVAFHTGVLGGSVTHRETNVEQGVEEVMISYGSGAQIQLLAPRNPASAIARFLDRSGPGLQQLAYRVTDLDTASDRLRKAGLRLLYDAARPGTAGSRINFIHPKDTGGVLVELVEPAAARSPDRSGASPTTGCGRASPPKAR